MLFLKRENISEKQTAAQSHSQKMNSLVGLLYILLVLLVNKTSFAIVFCRPVQEGVTNIYVEVFDEVF